MANENVISYVTIFLFRYTDLVEIENEPGHAAGDNFLRFSECPIQENP
jgi:hypothetical protein